MEITVKNAKLIRAGIVAFFIIILAGGIDYRNREKEEQLKKIASASEELDKLVNLHYRITTMDENEREGKSGISTEVWADLDSNKWVEIGTAIKGKQEEMHQAKLHDGTVTYGKNDKVKQWTELVENEEEIPYYTALKSFYYEKEDFSGTSVAKTEKGIEMTASLSEEAIQKLMQDSVESANQVYLTYVEKGETEQAEAAKRLMEWAQQTIVTKVEVSYTINEENMLVASTFTEHYKSPFLEETEGGIKLGEMVEHITTTEREVLNYNDEETTKTLHSYLEELDN